MKLVLTNPDDFVKSATIDSVGSMFVLNAKTKYGFKKHVAFNLRSLKILIGLHLIKGAKWKRVEDSK